MYEIGEQRCCGDSNHGMEIIAGDHTIDGKTPACEGRSENSDDQHARELVAQSQQMTKAAATVSRVLSPFGHAQGGNSVHLAIIQCD
jgi:hypothetical protein